MLVITMSDKYRLQQRELKGFSLVELMVAITVLAILAGIAAPSFREMIASQRARAAASELYASLLLARSEAIKRNNTVKIASTSTDDLNLANGWHVQLADGTTNIRTQEAFSGVTFSPSGPTLAYSSLGRLTSSSQTIEISGSGSTKVWSVRTEASGRVCIVEGGTSC